MTYRFNKLHSIFFFSYLLCFESCCEHSNEPSDAIKVQEFLDHCLLQASQYRKVVAGRRLAINPFYLTWSNQFVQYFLI
jgi:hypothetical protein